jgi:branched-chain amino acid aminotransferase
MDITRVSESQIGQHNFDELEFGRVFTDYMMYSDFDGVKWSAYTIEPLKPLSMHPGTSVLHYGQAIFEGLKAYRCAGDEINLFRIHDNIARLNISADRMQMPQIDESMVILAIQEFIRMQRDWVPQKSQGSLYIRPFMIAMDDTLRALPSTTYRFMVIACPVGFYYNHPLKIKLERNFRRAATGGVGYAKAAGNYGASFKPSKNAKELGYDQVLWTDITNNFTLEELGSANFFYTKGDVLVTPKLKDSILAGVTRDTVLKYAKSIGVEIIESLIQADEFEQDLKDGLITSMFATGTAASISYINEITVDGETYRVSSNTDKLVLEISAKINAIKFMEMELYPEWNVVV